MKRIRSWRWMARRRWRRARLPIEVGALLLRFEALMRAVSAMGGRVWSIETAVKERGREPILDTEPRGWVSKPGGAMKSSAVTPGAIWRLPRRDVGLLRLVGAAALSAGVGPGDEDPPKGECHAGSDILRLVLAVSDLLDSCGNCCLVPGWDNVGSSGATVSSSIFSLFIVWDLSSLTACSIAPRSTELCADRSALDERSLSCPKTLNSYPTWV